eukprot:1909355-Amphidinium_carterae.2
MPRVDAHSLRAMRIEQAFGRANHHRIIMVSATVLNPQQQTKRWKATATAHTDHSNFTCVMNTKSNNPKRLQSGQDTFQGTSKYFYKRRVCLASDKLSLWQAVTASEPGGANAGCSFGVVPAAIRRFRMRS